MSMGNVLGDLHVSAVRGRVQRRPALEVAHVDRRAALQQPRREVRVVVDTRLHHSEPRIRTRTLLGFSMYGTS